MTFDLGFSHNPTSPRYILCATQQCGDIKYVSIRIMYYARRSFFKVRANLPEGFFRYFPLCETIYKGEVKKKGLIEYLFHNSYMSLLCYTNEKGICYGHLKNMLY